MRLRDLARAEPPNPFEERGDGITDPHAGEPHEGRALIVVAPALQGDEATAENGRHLPGRGDQAASEINLGSLGIGRGLYFRCLGGGALGSRWNGMVEPSDVKEGSFDKHIFGGKYEPKFEIGRTALKFWAVGGDADAEAMPCPGGVQAQKIPGHIRLSG